MQRHVLKVVESIFLDAEKQYSEWNFSVANTDVIFRHFDDAEKMCKEILEVENLREKLRRRNVLLPSLITAFLAFCRLFRLHYSHATTTAMNTTLRKFLDSLLNNQNTGFRSKSHVPSPTI